MKTIRRTAAVLALAATTGMAASPAMAGRGHHYRPYHHDHHHHRGGGGDGFGTFLGVAALIGAVAIIASSADKNARADRERTPDRRDWSDAEDRAVDDCALAAREEAERQARHADIASIGEVRSVTDGWNVDGTVELRDSYRDTAEVRRFSCDWRGGRVANVYLSRDVLALR